jgi:cytochrome c biogenesis factor
MREVSIQAHMAFILFLAGIVVSQRQKTQVTQWSHSGFQIRLGDKLLSLRSIDQSIGPTYRSICGNIVLQHSDTRQFAVFPEKRFYLSGPSGLLTRDPDTSRQSTEVVNTKVAIHTNGLSDISVLIGAGSNESGWFLTVMELPFLACIWFAFVLAAFAGARSINKQLQLHQVRWI